MALRNQMRETFTMRKLSLLGPFALLIVLMLQQQSPAWLNFKFGAGINWNWQSGGNNVFWGLFRNGQPPGFGNTCDPSCTPNQFMPFNIGGCPQNCGMQGCGMQGCGMGMMQSPCMMPGQCQAPPMMPWMGQPQPPWMGGGQPCPQQPCGPQGSCNPPLFPSFNNGHCNPHEFQYFGQQQVPNGAGGMYDARQTVAAYNNYQYQTPASSYYPHGSASYYGNWSNSYYPYGSASYYGAPSTGYNYPASWGTYTPYASTQNYDPNPWYNSYQANPYYYTCNLNAR